MAWGGGPTLMGGAIGVSTSAAGRTGVVLDGLTGSPLALGALVPGALVPAALAAELAAALRSRSRAFSFRRISSFIRRAESIDLCDGSPVASFSMALNPRWELPAVAM